MIFCNARMSYDVSAGMVTCLYTFSKPLQHDCIGHVVGEARSRDHALEVMRDFEVKILIPNRIDSIIKVNV